MGMRVFVLLLLGGCACEPIDLDASGCGAAFATCDLCPPDFSVPLDLSVPVDLSPSTRDLTVLDGGFDDGGVDDGG